MDITLSGNETREFDTEKSAELMSRVVSWISSIDSSATTAHAVLDLNREDGGKRRFILVQMPEETDSNSEACKAGYKTIAEIGKERIRRVIKKISDEKAAELGGTYGLDLGFKVFKLTESHYKPWRNYHGQEVKELEALFEEYRTPLVENWRGTEDGLLTEILLIEGFPLDSRVREMEEYRDNRVRQISCGFHENRLLVCPDDTIQAATVKALALKDGDIFVCLDTAVDDQTKSRLSDKGLIKTI
jgi:adenine-specific DNA-methyltransferase